MDENIVNTAVERIDGALAAFSERHGGRLDELNDRVEDLEVKRMHPNLATNPPAPKYREIFTGEGNKAYELSSKQRFADVPAFSADTGVSLDRVLGALALGSNCGDAEAVEFANEMKTTTTGTSGVTLQNSVAAQWIDMVRAQSVLFQAGARSISMPTQSMSYIHVTNDPTVSWRSTEGASLTASDPTFAARTLTAITAACRTQLSLEASQDVPDAGRQIAQVQTRAMAAALDTIGFIGTGSEPTGIHNMPGVGTVTGVGTPTNYDELVSGVTEFLVANNALEDVTGIVMHPGIWSVYQTLKTGMTSDNTPLELPPAIATIPQFVSTGADIVASPEDYHITLGNFDDLLVGFRMDPIVRILDGTTSMASNLLIEIVGVMRVDVVALRPASFVVLEDVTT